MKDNLLPILALIALVSVSCLGNDRAPARTDRLPEPDRDLRIRDHLVKELTGHWVDSADDGRTVFHERWSPDGVGLGYVMVAHDTVWIEHLGIRPDGVDAPLIYTASIASQNGGDTIPFAWRPSNDSTLLFANPEHDFPRSIRYVRHRGGWTVTLDGVEKGIARQEVLHFVPVASDSTP